MEILGCFGGTCGPYSGPHHQYDTTFKKGLPVRGPAHLPSPLDLKPMEKRCKLHPHGKDEAGDTLFSIHFCLNHV